MDIVEKLREAATFFEQPPPPTLPPPDVPLNKLLRTAAEEIERLRAFEEAYDKLIEELQGLGKEFNCPAGMRRIDWLREQLKQGCLSC